MSQKLQTKSDKSELYTNDNSLKFLWISWGDEGKHVR